MTNFLLFITIWPQVVTVCIEQQNVSDFIWCKMLGMKIEKAGEIKEICV